MQDATALVRACLTGDALARLALGDYLEEQNDPRLALWRLGDVVRAAPKGTIALPCRAWYDNGKLRTSRPDWPLITATRSWPRGRCGKRLPHRLGKLFAIALCRELVPDKFVWHSDFMGWLTRWELHACGLAGVVTRDDLKGGRRNWLAPNYLASNYPNSRPPLLAGRTGSFGSYVCCAYYLVILARRPVGYFPCSPNANWDERSTAYVRSAIADLEASAAPYARVLEMHAAFLKALPDAADCARAALALPPLVE